MGLIFFEQQGKHLFEGELFCEVCGFRGKADLDTAFAHKRGFHLVNTTTQSKTKPYEVSADSSQWVSSARFYEKETKNNKMY